MPRYLDSIPEFLAEMPVPAPFLPASTGDIGRKPVKEGASALLKKRCFRNFGGISPEALLRINNNARSPEKD